jgi:hypothetical protein
MTDFLHNQADNAWFPPTLIEFPAVTAQQGLQHAQNPLEVTNPQQQLQHSQQRWAAIFRSSQEVPVADVRRPIALSVENMRENVAWGDPLQEKPANVTRVYAMNVNGMRLDQRGGQLDDLCKVLKEVQADVFCGQEHNLDSDDTKVRQIVHRTTRQHWHRSRALFGTSPIVFSSQFKPGGAFMITTGNLSGRISEQLPDKWG